MFSLSTGKVLPEKKEDAMKRLGGRIALCALLLTVALVGSSLAASDTQTVKVGLAALASANLENSVGNGYQFGYYDGAGTFISLGSTDTTQISMLKTQNLYLAKDGTYTTVSSGSTGTIGCYHLQLPGTYSSFSAAQSKAATVTGGFPAWVSGTYYVRTGAYATEAAAKTAQSTLGVNGTAIVGTTSSGISVTQTKTTKILFQYDNAGGAVFSVKPGTSGETSTKTWFKGNKYAGSFLYERIGGGNLTVVNYVTMDDYLKGIIPYEMSSSWPAEALKAQAVCARSYVLSSTGSKHASESFPTSVIPPAARPIAAVDEPPILRTHKWTPPPASVRGTTERSPKPFTMPLMVVQQKIVPMSGLPTYPI
ncbi:MAG: SpoIID/LytB domain-containing protein [Evtepia sp.]